VGHATRSIFNQMHEREETIYQQSKSNAIMKNLIETSERDPRKDAITKEDWVVYGIVAPIVFMLILGVGEGISRLFG
jgi:predicted Holliday junction resolvase-like endonuclease